MKVFYKTTNHVLETISKTFVHTLKYTIQNSKHIRDLDLNLTANQILNSTNLSESSLNSEVISAHVISNMIEGMHINKEKEKAAVSLYKSETDIVYNFGNCKKTDYVLNVSSSSIDNTKDNKNVRIAVEVKRCLDFAYSKMTTEHICNILDKANTGAIESNRGVSSMDKWDCQILNILTTNKDLEQIINKWIISKTKFGFAAIVITLVDGNVDLIIKS